MNGTLELAGPERFRFDELARGSLRAHDDRSLVPGGNPRIAPTRFGDWLGRSTARAARPRGGPTGTSSP